MLKHMLLTAVVSGHNCVAVRCRTVTDSNAWHHAVLHQWTYDDAACMNAAIEANVLVDVRRALYGIVRSVNGVLRMQGKECNILKKLPMTWLESCHVIWLVSR